VSKKVFFCAVALVAFSVSSMANEIEEKKVEEINNNAETTIGCDHCYDYADSLDDGTDRTNKKWMRNVDKCKVTNGCEAVFTELLNP
jgi:hypothetical protein